jgi:HAD superfamily hydrolase (TIGR01493 family)
MSLEAFVFDAYGTLYDVHAVMQRCESFFAGKGLQLSQLWRAKQLEYTWQRSLMQRYVPFSTVTREALAYACETLGLELTAERMEALMGEYNMLASYPDVPRALSRLKGSKLAILSNGSPDMLGPLVRRAEDVQTGAPGLRTGRLETADTQRPHRLRLVELLGCARRQVLRLQRLLDQPRRRPVGPPWLQARPNRQDPR